MEYRSGFIAIIGCPNVGKSMLLNALVGQKVSIVTRRAQTTRNKIVGVVHGENAQVVLLDTPGVHEPKNRLGDYMASVTNEALREVEGVMLVLDAAVGVKARDEALMERLSGVKNVIAVVNKTDIAAPKQIEDVIERLREQNFCACCLVSALTGAGLEALKSELFSLAVKGPQYFPEDMVTDQPERVIAAEMVREAALNYLLEEVPHGVGVDIEKMETREDGLVEIWAAIYCEKDSHKGIIIGKGGAMLKKIGSAAREQMEWLLGARVHLQLWVKVREDWRNHLATLRMLGYQ